jgi:hypothetical protein
MRWASTAPPRITFGHRIVCTHDGRRRGSGRPVGQGRLAGRRSRRGPGRCPAPCWCGRALRLASRARAGVRAGKGDLPVGWVKLNHMRRRGRQRAGVGVARARLDGVGGDGRACHSRLEGGGVGPRAEAGASGALGWRCRGGWGVTSTGRAG